MMKQVLSGLLLTQCLWLTTVNAAEEAEPFFANETNSSVTASASASASATAAATGAELTDAAKEKLPETEIPINITEKKVEASSESGFGRIMISLGVLLMTGIGIFLYMRKYVKPSAHKNQQIKVLTQHYLGPKKSLAIIRVAGESILIGVTDHNISMIKSLSLLDEEIPEFSEKDFSAALEKSNQRTHANRKDMDLEDFSMKGIRDIVSKKLSQMRTLE